VEEEVIPSLRAGAIVHQHKSPDCRQLDVM
jgi:hypothetical protein